MTKTYGVIMHNNTMKILAVMEISSNITLHEVFNNAMPKISVQHDLQQIKSKELDESLSKLRTPITQLYKTIFNCKKQPISLLASLQKIKDAIIQQQESLYALNAELSATKEAITIHKINYQDVVQRLQEAENYIASLESDNEHLKEQINAI